MSETHIACIASQQVPALREAHKHEHREAEGEKEKGGLIMGKAKSVIMMTGKSICLGFTIPALASEESFRLKEQDSQK